MPIANHNWKFSKHLFKDTPDDFKNQSEDRLFFKIQKNEFKAWNRDLPEIKKVLTQTINHLKNVLHGQSPRFEEVTLMELRDLWKKMIDMNKANQLLSKEERYNYFNEKAIVTEMMSKINSWFRQSHYCIWGIISYNDEQPHRSIQTRMADKFELKTSSNFNDVKVW